MGESKGKEIGMDCLNKLAAVFYNEGFIQQCAISGQMPESQWRLYIEINICRIWQRHQNSMDA
jgi:hypothetical protein